jgi:hypothetical protein
MFALGVSHLAPVGNLDVVARFDNVRDIMLGVDLKM